MIKLEKSLIIDNGTYEFKCGWCDEEYPSYIKKSTYNKVNLSEKEKPTIQKFTKNEKVLFKIYKKIKKNVPKIKKDFDIFENGKVKYPEGFCKSYEKIIKKMILKKKYHPDNPETHQTDHGKSNFAKNIFDVKKPRNLFENAESYNANFNFEKSNTNSNFDIFNTNSNYEHTNNPFNQNPFSKNENFQSGFEYKERLPPILLLESSNIEQNSKSKKEFITWMFEKMNVSVLGLTSQVLMDLFATGLTSGLVVDSGHGHTQIAPIIEGFTLKHYQISENISGYEFNRKIQSIFQKNNILISNTNEFFDLIKKESRGVYSKNDVDQIEFDIKHFPDSKYSRKFILPDNNQIEVDLGFISVLYNHDFFNPQFKGSPSKSLPYLMNKTIKLYSEKVHKLLKNNIVICGGNSNIINLNDMIIKEINKTEFFNGNFANIEVDYKPEYLAWKGGAIVSQLPNCNAFWMTKSEFEEEGTLRILKRKLANAPNFL